MKSLVDTSESVAKRLAKRLEKPAFKPEAYLRIISGRVLKAL